MGHIYHRRWEQTYESSVFEWEDERTWGSVTYKADAPKGTGLAFEVRTAPAAEGLPAQAWRGVGEGGFSIQSQHRVLQYRAVLTSENGDRFPVVDRVRVSVQARP